MGKEIATQVQEIQRAPNRINPRQHTPRHILIKLTKIRYKEQILKEARGKKKKQITYKGIPIRISVDLSIETLQAKREWQDIPKERKKKTYNLQPTKKTYNPDYCTQEVLIQIQRRNQKLYRQAKAEKIQYHQTSS